MTHELGPLPARWYSVSNDGLATRCHDEEDARYNATQNDLAWPRGAPHRAVQLVDVAEVARAVAAERATQAELLEALRGMVECFPVAITSGAREDMRWQASTISAAHAAIAKAERAQAHGQTPESAAG